MILENARISANFLPFLGIFFPITHPVFFYVAIFVYLRYIRRVIGLVSQADPMRRKIVFASEHGGYN